MIYRSRPNGTHGVFPSQKQGQDGYIGAFDIVKLTPETARDDEGYPEGSFIGNRVSLAAARAWADTCDKLNAR